MSTSVEKALQIVMHLAAEPISGSELARRLEVHRSTSSRLLRTLEEYDFVRREPEGTLHLGSFFASLPLLDIRRAEIVGTARPQLERLGQSTGLTIHLAGLEPGRVAYWDKIESHQTIRMYSTIGATAAPHATGVGKAVLAHLTDRRRRTLVGGGSELEGFTKNTHRTFASLTQDLENVAERGWALDDEEHEEFIHCIAAPIFDAQEQAVAAVSITAPQFVVDTEQLRSMLPDLLRTSRRISKEMGDLS